MTVFLFIVFIGLLLMLIVTAAIEPGRARFSPYELERRGRDRTSDIAMDIDRESLYPDILSLQRVTQAFLIVALTLASVGVFGWVLGGLIAFIVSLEFRTVGSIGDIRRFVASYYSKYERSILDFVKRHSSVVRWIRSTVPANTDRQLNSREELQHIVETSRGILDEQEKRLFVGGLTFGRKTVMQVMTPKSVVDTIKATEVLGPLVLDDLHKTGHSRFPVIGEDIDHIVGILYVRDVLSVDTDRQHSITVEQAMSKRVYYIRDDHTLDQALSAFLRTHHHLFVVINVYRETVGILTLEDTLEALLGRRIIDEFDAHDDMRAVASRNAKKSSLNKTVDSKDV